MALPKDPTTKTSATTPPPKEPPVVKSGIFTPKPPPDLPPNVRVSSPAQAIANLRVPDISDEALIAAFKDKPLYVLGRVSWPKLKSPDRKRLENLINQDPALKKILNYVLPVYPQAAPQTQPQPAPAAPAAAAPTRTAEQLSQQEPAIAPKTNEITAETAPQIQAWMNGIKPGFYKWLGEKKFDAATSQHMFTNSFLEYLAMYKGGLAGFYLSQGAHELMYSALGPIGEALSGLHQKDLRWKMAWMKNPLNPNALYYYLNVLPEEQAFKLLFLPVKATWVILARGGAPLISKTTYRETDHRRRDYGQVKTGYFFSPTLRLARGANILADGLDKLTGIPTDDNFFRLDQSQDSPYDRYIKSKNSAFSKSLQELKSAKLSKNKDSIEKAQHNLRLLLNEHDGFYRYYKDKNGKLQEISKLPFWRRTAFGAAGVSRAIFKNGLKNFSRRARRASRDPITGIFALIAGTLVDILAGIGINILRVAANRVIDLASRFVPGINTLRATLTEFFTSNRWLQTARIGGATGQAFLKGTFSMTTASTTYAGASVGGWIANALGLPAYPFQVIGGGIGATFGSIYTTSLKMAANPNIINWIYKYDDLLFRATDPYSSIARQNFYRGELEKEFLRVYPDRFKSINFRPGPLTRFANWLHNNPFARLPINGFVIADLGVKLLGWNPWVAYPSLIAGDYLWQVKGAIARSFAQWFPTTALGRSLTSASLSVQTWFTEKIFMRPIAWETSSLLGKMPVKWALRPFWQGLQNVWSTVQPYISNFFNPGFFMGMQSLGSVFMSMGLPWGVAHLVGGLAGTGLWLGVSRLVQSIVGGGAGFLSSFTAWGWSGYIIGSILDLIIPGAQPGLAPALGIGFPMIGAALHMFGLSFISLLSSGLAWLGTAIPALSAATGAMAAGLAGWATALSIGLVAGLTIFAGFVIYSAFWVPLQEMMHAGPQSACFNLQTSANIASDSAEICSKFTVTTDLLTDKGYIRNEIGGVYNLLLADYVNLENNITKATRQIPNQALENLNYVASPEFINPGNPLVATNRYTFPLSENILQLADSRGIMLSYLVSWLSTFTGNPNSNKMTIFDLIAKYPQFPGLQQMVNSSFDLLKQVQADETAGRNDTIYKFEKTRDFTKDQKDTYGAIRDKLVAAKNSTTLETIKNNLISAKTKAETAAQTNPFSNQVGELQNNCQYQTATCQKLIQLYQSWPNFFNNQLIAINNLINQANDLDVSSDLTNLMTNVAAVANSANFTFNSLDQQYQSYKSLTEELDDFQNDLNDWLSILNTSSPTTEQIQEILKKVFASMFNETYFFTPNGTKYEICVKGTYVGDPNKPAYFYSETDMVQPGLMGIGSLNTCSAIASTTINP